MTPDDGEDAEVHAHIDGDLRHESTADAGTDEAAQHILTAGAGGKGLADQRKQDAQHHTAAHEAGGVADPAEDEIVVGVGDAVIAAAENTVAEMPPDPARSPPLLLVVMFFQTPR